MKNDLIIWFAIITHILWGILLLLSPTTANITAVNELSHIFKNRFVLGSVLVYVGVSASIGLAIGSRGILFLLLVIPQQFFLVVSAYGAGQAIMNSAFADGVVRSRYFIGADQSPAIISMLLHTVAVIRHFFDRT